MKKTFRKSIHVLNAAAFILLAAVCAVLPAFAADTLPEIPLDEPLSVTAVLLTSSPAKLTYNVGDALDVTGAALTVSYSDGTSRSLSLQSDWCSGFDSKTPGEQTVTVKYPEGGSPASFKVKVIGESAISVTAPKKTSYFINEKEDRTGLDVYLVYTDGSKVQLKDGYTVSGFDSSAAGTKTVTVSYHGFSASYTVTVVQVKVNKIDITSKPKKTDYVTGEELDLSGLKVTASMSDGTTKDVTADVTASGYSLATSGSKTVTISYRSDDKIFKDTFTVTVKDPEVKSVEIKTLPKKTVYTEGDNFDGTGCVLSVTYSDGSTVELKDGFSFTGYDPVKPGEQTITVTYAGQSRTFTIKLNVSAAHKHSPGEYRITATAACGKPGALTSICTVCGEVADTREIPALDHKWGDWKVTKQPSEAAEGEQTRTCSLCGASETEAIQKISTVLTSPSGITAQMQNGTFPGGTALNAGSVLTSLGGVELASLSSQADKLNGEVVDVFDIGYTLSSSPSASVDIKGDIKYTMNLGRAAGDYYSLKILQNGRVIVPETDVDDVTGNVSASFVTDSCARITVVGVLVPEETMPPETAPIDPVTSEPETEPVDPAVTGAPAESGASSDVPSETQTPDESGSDPADTGTPAGTENITDTPATTEDPELSRLRKEQTRQQVKKAAGTIAIVIGIILVIAVILVVLYMYYIKKYY